MYYSGFSSNSDFGIGSSSGEDSPTTPESEEEESRRNGENDEEDVYSDGQHEESEDRGLEEDLFNINNQSSSTVQNPSQPSNEFDFTNFTPPTIEESIFGGSNHHQEVILPILSGSDEGGFGDLFNPQRSSEERDYDHQVSDEDEELVFDEFEIPSREPVANDPPIRTREDSSPLFLDNNDYNVDGTPSPFITPTSTPENSDDERSIGESSGDGGFVFEDNNHHFVAESEEQQISHVGIDDSQQIMDRICEQHLNQHQIYQQQMMFQQQQQQPTFPVQQQQQQQPTLQQQMIQQQMIQRQIYQQQSMFQQPTMMSIQQQYMFEQYMIQQQQMIHQQQQILQQQLHQSTVPQPRQNITDPISPKEGLILEPRMYNLNPDRSIITILWDVHGENIGHLNRKKKNQIKKKTGDDVFDIYYSSKKSIGYRVEISGFQVRLLKANRRRRISNINRRKIIKKKDKEYICKCCKHKVSVAVHGEYEKQTVSHDCSGKSRSASHDKKLLSLFKIRKIGNKKEVLKEEFLNYSGRVMVGKKTLYLYLQ